MDDASQDLDGPYGEDDEGDAASAVPESVAEELYQAFMTHESAKQRYKASMQMRGTDGDALKELASERLRAAKAKSFCAGCKRRGHWHKDAECPLNAGKGSSASTSTTTSSTRGGNGGGTSTAYQCHVVHVTWDLGKAGSHLLHAITDTACTRTVAGTGWLESYLREAKKKGFKASFLDVNESFRFGASRVFEATYAAVVSFKIGGRVVHIKAAIVNGDVPLLLSRPVLARLGMVLDVAGNRASFVALKVQDCPLVYTETGHPALPVEPVQGVEATFNPHEWERLEIKVEEERAYMQGCGRDHSVFMVQEVFGDEDSERLDVESCTAGNPRNPVGRLFYPKKLGLAIQNMLISEKCNVVTFLSWWNQTNISNDFWVEGPQALVRVHVIPQKSLFDPSCWKTKEGEHKQALLDALGSIRSTFAVSCKTH